MWRTSDERKLRMHMLRNAPRMRAEFWAAKVAACSPENSSVSCAAQPEEK